MKELSSGSRTPAPRSPWRVLLLLATLVPAGMLATGRPLTVAGGSTRLYLYPHLLRDLGVELRPAAAEGRMHFAVRGPEAGRLEIDAPGGSFHGFGGGSLVHEGRFELRWAGGGISLAGFELRRGATPLALSLVTADGLHAFELDHPHPWLARGELAVRNLDLRIAEPLAVLLGRPELAGAAVGQAELVAHLQGDGGGEPGAALCTPDFSGTVDVQLDAMTSLSERFHDTSRVALAPAVRLLNVGTADVEWKRAILPDGGGSPTVVGKHPFLVMNLYRLAGGVLEQIGRSDAKHGFFSANTPPCSCQPDQVLFVNCTDLYGAFTNSNRDHLAPRDEVDAFGAAWTSLGSHFDGTPADDFRDHGEADHVDPFEHRLTARTADLQTPGAAYFAEAWYLVDGDVDIFNSMGHRRFAPSYSGSSWSFPFQDAGLSLGSVLDRWVDPAAPPPNSASTAIDTGEGRLRLAAIATLLPSGLYRYEYALMNFDFDRQIRAMSLPLPAGLRVQNAGFGDGDGGNEWPATVTPGEIAWQAPAGNALDWGTLFNFRFEANAAPGDRLAELEFLEAGPTASTTAASKAPGDTLIPAVELTVSLGGAGAGAVSSSPPGIDCAPDCREIVLPAAAVELTASPHAGSAFERWEESGLPPVLDLRHQLSVDADRVVTAVFEPCQPDVSLPFGTVTGPELFTACNHLEATSGFVVAGPNGRAILRSGRSIVLGDGFTVERDAAASAELVPGQSTP